MKITTKNVERMLLMLGCPGKDAPPNSISIDLMNGEYIAFESPEAAKLFCARVLHSLCPPARKCVTGDYLGPDEEVCQVQ
jgi:hypothetical protein